MSECPGLIPCLTATPGPTGLRPDEVARLGTAYGTFFAVVILIILIILTVAVTLAVFLATKE